MAKIVCVHGIGQQLKGAAAIEAEWVPALRSGLQNAGLQRERLAEAKDVRVAFYGDIFRAAGGHRNVRAGIPYEAADLDSEWEQEFVTALYDEVRSLDQARPNTTDQAERSVPLGMQNMLYRLCGSEFFAQAATVALIVGDLKQVYAYLHHDDVREACRQRVLATLGPDTRVVIAHSLGSIVAYEALCRQEHQVESFITLGSPLGIPNLVLPYLDPKPDEDGGKWSAWAKRWVNISDDGDVVALAKRLSPLFGQVEDVRVSNEATAHDACPYLTARETGEVVAWALDPRRAATGD